MQSCMHHRNTGGSKAARGLSMQHNAAQMTDQASKEADIYHI